MRKQSTIAVLLLASIATMMVANPGMPAVVNSLEDDAASDTTKMDSLQKAIWKHNKVVDDSIRLDSINRKKSGGIDAPVNYQADDSLVYGSQQGGASLWQLEREVREHGPHLRPHLDGFGQEQRQGERYSRLYGGRRRQG